MPGCIPPTDLHDLSPADRPDGSSWRDPGGRNRVIATAILPLFPGGSPAGEYQPEHLRASRNKRTPARRINECALCLIPPADHSGRFPLTNPSKTGIGKYLTQKMGLERIWRHLYHHFPDLPVAAG